MPELLVIGGGPAGLTAAKTAASRGVNTLLVERHSEIGYPVHTSGGSWIDHMEEFSVPTHLYNPIHRAVFLSPHQETAFDYPSTRGCVVNVRGLYQFLAEQAVAVGADIRVKHTADRLLIRKGRTVGASVKSHTGALSEVLADVVIDASGFSRKLAARAGLGAPYLSYAFAAEYELYAPYCSQDAAYFVMGRALAPYGYGWVFPSGNSRVRVGVGVIHPQCRDDARDYLEKLCVHPRLRDELRNSSAIEFHTGLFPVSAPLSHLSTHGLMFAGDAGGQNSQSVGEGIRFAMLAGKMAGEVAADAIANRNSSADFLKQYDRQWQSRYGRSLWFAHKIGKLMISNEDRHWDAYLKNLNCLNSMQTETFLRSDITPAFIVGIATHLFMRPAAAIRTIQLTLGRLRNL